MTSHRVLPVPDETSSPYWDAASRHVLTAARCGQCGVFAMPPDVVCTACGSTNPRYEFTPVSGLGVVRAWVVVRQSFLPGFEVPFVLVDVELAEQPELRLIGRLLDGEPTRGATVRAAFEDLADGISVPAWELA